MINHLRITVFTPVYNRRHTIHRVFESLQNQTYKEFEWLVIDDGSTDGVEETIKDYIDQAHFTIRYYYKENGGKHTAINLAYQLMESEYFVILDSDDTLNEDALERMLFYWDSMPTERKALCWCVVGLCADSKTGEVVGDRFPEDINLQLNPGQAAKKVNGEKHGCLKLDIAKRYPFPEPDGTSFITESIVWNRIGKEYFQFYVNDIFRVYYMDEPDSLTTAWYKNHVKEGYISNYFWKLFKLNDEGVQNANDWKVLFLIPYYGSMAGKKTKEILGGIKIKKYKIIITFMLIPAKLAKIIRGRKYDINRRTKMSG